MFAKITEFSKKRKTLKFECLEKILNILDFLSIYKDFYAHFRWWVLWVEWTEWLPHRRRQTNNFILEKIAKNNHILETNFTLLYLARNRRRSSKFLIIILFLGKFSKWYRVIWLITLKLYILVPDPAGKWIFAWSIQTFYLNYKLCYLKFQRIIPF